MIELLPELENILTFQDYPPTPEIEGVWIQALHKHRADNGWFMEYTRVNQGHLQNTPTPFEIRQISISRAEPGRINAFHIHTKLEQNEIWTVIQGQLVVWLVDCRKHSKTAGIKQRLILSGEQPMRIHIPAGVAHGYKAGQDGAILLYAMDQQFNQNNPNEGRFSHELFGKEIWEAKKT